MNGSYNPAEPLPCRALRTLPHSYYCTTSQTYLLPLSRPLNSARQAVQQKETDTSPDAGAESPSDPAPPLPPASSLMPPRAAKRARGSRAGAAAAARPALTSAERTKMVNRLSADDARAILADLVASSPAARAAVEAELERQDESPVDLEEYSGRASEIMWSVDGLRDSQVYQRSGEVMDRLTDLASECRQQLSTTHAFQAIVAVVVSVESAAEGKIRGYVFGCGGFEPDVAEILRELAEDMTEEEKASVDDAVEDLQGAAEAMEDYGSGFEFAKVVKDVRGE